MQGDFRKMQGDRDRKLAKNYQISTSWVMVSLLEGAGKSRENDLAMIARGILEARTRFDLRERMPLTHAAPPFFVFDLTKHASGQSSFARKIGLSPKNRKPRLEAALEEAAAWYATHGGELKWIKKGAKIWFTKEEPTVPKNPKKGEGL
jgi:hypothetical protein